MSRSGTLDARPGQDVLPLGSGGKYTMEMAYNISMPNIIPRIARMEEMADSFLLNDVCTIIPDQACTEEAKFLLDFLNPILPRSIQKKPGHEPGKKSISLKIDPSLVSLGSEGYRLEVHPDKVVISAPQPAGIFYGIQSLRQMLPPEMEFRKIPEKEIRIPCMMVEDSPRFPWRGFMLDEGRHFHGKQTVMQLLDLMALMKLNRFHWHLTEDQGWRIEIKKYPRLTEIGSFRPGTSQSRISKKHDGIPHQGFYTQDEIREIIAYADDRHIMVIPEIEIPGHCLAALASYPQFSCTGGPFSVATQFSIFKDIYCPGKDGTIKFLKDVLEEVMNLFPSPYIHIGGDEAPKSRWKECPDCQRRIQQEGLINEHALQVWFTNQIAQFLGSRGRRLMGWNQILEKGLVEKAVVQFWMGDLKKLVNAVHSEHREVVMSSFWDTYLDYSYALIPLRRTYAYDPVMKEFEGGDSTSILGLEFPLWTEWVPNRSRLDYQTFPRLCAAAETGWTPKHQKNYPDFLDRLESIFKRFDYLGVSYASVQESDPSKIRQFLGPFTIAQAQKRVSKPGQKSASQIPE